MALAISDSSSRQKVTVRFFINFSSLSKQVSTTGSTGNTGRLIFIAFPRVPRFPVVGCGANARWFDLARVFIDLAALHHEDDTSQGGDVTGRVAVNGDQIGLKSRRESSDAVFQIERFRGQRSRRDDRVHRLLATFAHA